MSSRKRKAFTFAEKLQIVDRIKNGETQARLSRDTGEAESTIRGWLKAKDRLRQASSKMDDCGQVGKRARLAKNQQLDEENVNSVRDTPPAEKEEGSCGPPPISEVLQALDTVMRWVETSQRGTVTKVMQVRNLVHDARADSREKIVQTKLFDRRGDD